MDTGRTVQHVAVSAAAGNRRVDVGVPAPDLRFVPLAAASAAWPHTANVEVAIYDPAAAAFPP